MTFVLIETTTMVTLHYRRPGLPVALPLHLYPGVVNMVEADVWELALAKQGHARLIDAYIAEGTLRILDTATALAKQEGHRPFAEAQRMPLQALAETYAARDARPEDERREAALEAAARARLQHEAVDAVQTPWKPATPAEVDAAKAEVDQGELFTWRLSDGSLDDKIPPNSGWGKGRWNRSGGNDAA